MKGKIIILESTDAGNGGCRQAVRESCGKEELLESSFERGGIQNAGGARVLSSAAPTFPSFVLLTNAREEGTIKGKGSSLKTERSSDVLKGAVIRRFAHEGVMKRKDSRTSQFRIM